MVFVRECTPPSASPPLPPPQSVAYNRRINSRNVTICSTFKIPHFSYFRGTDKELSIIRDIVTEDAVEIHVLIHDRQRQRLHMVTSN